MSSEDRQLRYYWTSESDFELRAFGFFLFDTILKDSYKICQTKKKDQTPEDIKQEKMRKGHSMPIDTISFLIFTLR